MQLSNEQFESIVEEVTKRLRPVVQPSSQSPRGAETGMPAMVLLPPEFYQSQREISDRVARLEERFVQFDTRFEQTQSSMDQRFKEMQSSMDKRFEAVDKRFEEMQHQLDKRFDAVDKRFETVDKRFETVDKRFETVDKRFEAVDKRFEALDRRFNGVVALISVSTVIVGGLVVLFQVL